MEDLIQIGFFVVIIVASLLDGVRRQRQKQKSVSQQGRRPPLGGMEARSTPGPGTPPEEVDWSDGSPKLDHLEEEVEAVVADGMVPTDLWEEIRSMARGEPPPKPIESEPPLQASTLPLVPDDTSSWDEFEDRGEGGEGWQSEVLQTQVAAARDARIRQRRMERATREEAESAAAMVPAVSARGRLGLGGIEDVRRAILLKEVLGPPLGLIPPEVLPKD